MPLAKETRASQGKADCSEVWILSMVLQYHAGTWLCAAASSENKTGTQLTANDYFEDEGRERLNFREAEAKASWIPKGVQVTHQSNSNSR